MKVPETIAFGLSFGVEGTANELFQDQKLGDDMQIGKKKKGKQGRGSWTTKKETAWMIFNV